jgi:hypothetical protein
MVTLDTVALQRAVAKEIDGYRNKTDDFVADYVAPAVKVDTPNGYLPRYGRAHQKLIISNVGPYAPTNRVDYNVLTTEFNCTTHRLAANLPFEVEAYDDTKLLDAASLGVVVDEALRIQREYELAAFLTDDANFTNEGDPGDWTGAGANPAWDVSEQAVTIHGAINRWPKYGLATGDVAMFLRSLVAVIGAASGSTALASLEEVARYLGLKELRIAGAGYDSARPGHDSVGARLFGTENFWLFHKPEEMNKFSPTFMATARYEPLSTARVWPIPDPEGVTVESRDCYDLVEVDETGCYYFHDVLS